MLAGANEKSSVCNMHAIDDGYRMVKEVDCNAKEPLHTLVLLSCPPLKAPLELGAKGMGLMGSLTPGPLDGVGLRVESQMYQCLEVEHTNKDAQNRTYITYTYTPGYYGHPVPYHKGHDCYLEGPNALQSCGGSNPQWPASVPEAQTVWNERIKVGNKILSKDFAHMISLNTPVHPELSAEWKAISRGLFECRTYEQRGPLASTGGVALGTMRAQFFSNTWDPVTVLGYEATGNSLEIWHAPSAWLCSGFDLGTLREAVLNKAKMFETLHEENSSNTLFVRALAFCLCWGAFAAMVHPLGVLADMLLCVQSCGLCVCLANSIDCLLCTAACLPATACFMLVAGIVWVVMRPMVGGPMLFLTVGIFGFLGYIKSLRSANPVPVDGDGNALLGNQAKE